MLYAIYNQLILYPSRFLPIREVVLVDSGGITVKLSWALAVSGDLDVDELGNSDNGDTGVQDDAKNNIILWSLSE